jgi:glycosyltransferase involved in cell wall biosynthesis
MRVAIVIPAHNEAASLPAVIADVRAQIPEADVVVVDDGSTDGTETVLRALGVDWLRFPFCLGIGTAMRAGMRRALDRGCEAIVRLDADGQHKAGDVAAVLAPLRAGRADVVQGSRYLNGGGKNTPFFRRLLQRMLSVFLRPWSGRPITDPTSGFWAFGPRVAYMLSIVHPTGYPEPELLLLLARNRVRFEEVPIQIFERTAGRSTLTAFRVLVALARVVLAMIVVPLRDTHERADP